MASPAPVLPLVGSTIVPPGLSWPERSARSTMASPMRSLTDPPGFRYSTLASRVGPRPQRRQPDQRGAADHLEDRVVHLHGRKHSPYSTSNHLGELVLVRRHPSRMSSAPASAERRLLLCRGWFCDTRG